MSQTSDNEMSLLFKKEGRDTLETSNRLTERFSTTQKNLVQLHDSSSSSDIIERVTQDYINAHHLSKSYVEKHVHLQEMYFTLSKVMLMYQQKRGDDSRILEHLMRLVKNANILSGEELDKLITEQRQIMDETKTINDKIDDEFFSEKNLLFRDLSDEQKEFIKHSSSERQNIAKQKMQDLQIFTTTSTSTRFDPHFQHLFEPVLDSFYRSFYNEDQTSFLVREITMRSDRKTIYDLLETMNMTLQSQELQYILPMSFEEKKFIYAEMAFKIVPLRTGHTSVYIEEILSDFIGHEEQNTNVMKKISIDSTEKVNLFQIVEFDLNFSSITNTNILILMTDNKSFLNMSLIYCFKTKSDNEKLVCYFHESLNLTDKDFFYVFDKELFTDKVNIEFVRTIDQDNSDLTFLLPRKKFERLVDTATSEKDLHYLLRDSFPIEAPVILTTNESHFQVSNKKFLFICASLFFYISHTISNLEVITIPRKPWFQRKLNLLDIKAAELHGGLTQTQVNFFKSIKIMQL
jgi:hypothetical protein